MLKNLLLFLFGLSQIIFVLLMKVMKVEKDFGKGISAPYTFGFISNLRYVAFRMSYMDLWRRLLFIGRNPHLAWQYLNIVKNKKIVSYVGRKTVPVKNLRSQHQISISPHHLMRVREAKEGKKLTAANEIVVLDSFIHDGHHRVDAYLLAGVEEVEVDFWTEIK